MQTNLHSTKECAISFLSFHPAFVSIAKMFMYGYNGAAAAPWITYLDSSRVIEVASYSFYRVI